MRLWVLSDLHLTDLGEKFRAPEADVCVVAGDVCEGVAQACRWLSVNVGIRMPVAFVPGNHEFYGGTVPGNLHLARRMIDAGEAPGVHLLDNEVIVIGGVRFVGATLWTDYRLNATAGEPDARDREVAWAMTTAERFVMDHATISVGDGAVKRRFTPSDAARLHRASLAFIEGELAREHAGPTVVVSHHPPHPGAVSPTFAGSALNPAFVSDLTPTLLAGQPELWVHGHVHSCNDFRVGDTRVLCNPRGYRSQGNEENPAFDRRKVVEVSARPRGREALVARVDACRVALADAEEALRRFDEYRTGGHSHD